MLLAGDVGGTKTLLGLFRRGPERPAPVHIREFPTLAYDGLAHMIAEFFRLCDPGEPIEAAGFGVAGPVLDEVAHLTNVPWQVSAAEVAERFATGTVVLLNDLTAMAHAVPVLQPDELFVLQQGDPVPDGNAALIAAGTGLGESLLHNVNGRFIPMPCEPGHADFAARTPREIELLVDLTRTYGRAEVEGVVSGPGLVNIFRFTHQKERCPVIDAGRGPGALPSLVTAAGLGRECPRCTETLELFVSAYGAEAGNMALRSVATAGVYVGGGIAPKILPALQTGAFLEAFRAKGPMTDLLAAVPVSVILNPHAGLIGAAVRANDVAA